MGNTWCLVNPWMIIHQWFFQQSAWLAKQQAGWFAGQQWQAPAANGQCLALAVQQYSAGITGGSTRPAKIGGYTRWIHVNPITATFNDVDVWFRSCSCSGCCSCSWTTAGQYTPAFADWKIMAVHPNTPSIDQSSFNLRSQAVRYTVSLHLKLFCLEGLSYSVTWKIC